MMVPLGEITGSAIKLCDTKIAVQWHPATSLGDCEDIAAIVAEIDDSVAGAKLVLK
jgi:hypothetical protein